MMWESAPLTTRIRDPDLYPCSSVELCGTAPPQAHSRGPLSRFHDLLFAQRSILTILIFAPHVGARGGSQTDWILFDLPHLGLAIVGVSTVIVLIMFSVFTVGCADERPRYLYGGEKSTSV